MTTPRSRDPIVRAARSGPRRLARAALTLAVLAGCGERPEGGATPGRPAFDGGAALDLVRRQVAFGPRVPGREGHAAQLAWMVARLDSLGAEVTADTFAHVHSSTGDTLRLVNVRARFRPDATRRIALFAHWDTRPTADEEADTNARDRPIPGANDGGSGTAVLLHLARVLAEEPPPLGVDLVFLDGEDYGPTVDDMFLGAERYASRLSEDGTRPVYGVLLDMVGDETPFFLQEGYSVNLALPVVRKVWAIADRLGHGAYFPERAGPPLQDDHLALNAAGLPTVNVIDFDYGPGNAYWHTSADDVANVSAATLGIVGDVVTELIYSGG